MMIVTKSRELPRVSISWSISHPRLSRSWRYIDDGMLYLENTDQCCRKILFSDMEGYHSVPTEKLCLCCDICKKPRKCSTCSFV